MINIKVNDSWSIGSDENNFILYRTWIGKEGKSKGQEKRSVDGYYQKMEVLLDRLIDKMLYESEATTLVELRDTLYASKRALTALLLENAE